MGYCKEVSGKCDGYWNTNFQWEPATLSLKVEFVEDATKYQVRVRAQNARGAGEWSSISTVTTT